jgi:hypothetical protein
VKGESKVTDFNTPFNEQVQTATKAVWATLTTAAGVVALFVTAIADGSVSTAEWGTIVTGVLTGAATVGAVWTARNKDKF